MAEFEQLDIDVNNLLAKLAKVDSQIDKTIGKLEKLYAAGATNKSGVGTENAALASQKALRQEIINKINQANLQLSRGEVADARKNQALTEELRKLTTLGNLYAVISEQARKIGENVGTSSLKFTRLTDIAAQLKAQIDAINVSIKKGAGNLEFKASDAGIASAQASKANAAARQLEVQATNEALGAYDQLVAKYQLAQRTALNLAASETATAAQREAAALEAAKYANQLGMVANSVNQLGNRAEKGIPAMYSFQQILLETPNAALGMRTYVMSLSNNLPMFIMQMQTLAATQEAGSTKTLGWAGAFKVLKGSMGWISLAMVAISTILIVVANNWDKITAAIGRHNSEVSKAINVTGAYSEQLRDSDGETQKVYGKIVLLSAAFTRLRTDTTGAAKNQANYNGIIKLANDVFGDYYGKVTSLNGAMEMYQKHAGRMIQLTLNMAVATKQADTAASLVLARRGVEAELQHLGVTGQMLKDLDSYGVVANNRRIVFARRSAQQLLDITQGATDGTNKTKDLLVQWGDAYDAVIDKVNSQQSSGSIIGNLGLFDISGDKKRAIEAAVLLRENITRELTQTKRNLAASMDDLVDTTDKKTRKYSAQLQDFTKKMLNFDYAEKTLEYLKGYYSEIANDENSSYERRLQAKDLYERAARQQTLSASKKELADLTTKYLAEQEADNNKLVKNREKLAKGAKDVIAIQNAQSEDVLKVIDNFNNSYLTADAATQKELLNNTVSTIQARIAAIIDESAKTTGNEKAYLLARANNLKNYLGEVTKNALDLTTALQGVALESIKLSGTIEISEMEKFFELLDNAAQNTNAKREIAAIGRSIEELKTQIATMNFSEAAQFEAELNEKVAAQNLLIDEAAAKTLVLKTKTEEAKAVRDRLFSTEALNNLGIDTKAISEIEVLNKLYSENMIKREDYEQQMSDIIKRYQGANAEKLAEYANGAVTQQSALNKQILDLERELTSAQTEEQKTRLNAQKAILDEMAAQMKSAYENTLSMAKDFVKQELATITDITNTRKDNYIERLDAEQEAADESKRIQLEALSVEGLSASEKEANEKKKDEIERWYAAQQKVRDEEKKNAEKQAAAEANNLAIVQAGVDLAITLADIRAKQIDYATTRMATYAAIPGLSATAVPEAAAVFAPMYALAATTSAMKIAALSMKKFATGGRVDKDMLAIVGDAGKTEYGVTKEGKVFETPSTPTVMGLERDTIIYPDKAAFLAKYINPKVNRDISRASAISYKDDMASINKLMARIEKNTRKNTNKGLKYYEYI